MTSLSVRRPLLILMCVLVVLLFGSISLTHLPLDLLPNFDAPALTVVAIWPGAGPRDVETQITKVLEKELASVNSLGSLSGYSVEGASVSVLSFDFGVDMAQALSQTRDKVDKAVNDLPEDVNRPLVEMVSLNTRPLATIILSGEVDPDRLVDYAETTVKNALERMDGVVSVDLAGHQLREIQVDVLPAHLERYGLDLSSIIGCISLANLSVPYGEIIEGDRSITVRGIAELNSLEELSSLPIPTATGATVPLEALAEIREGYSDQSSLFRHNGQPSLRIAIQKQQTANAVQVMDAVLAEIERLNAAHSEIQLTVIDDQSEFIRKSLGNVLESLLSGAALAIVVIYVFLRDLETSLIIATSIPISVIGAVAGLYFSGATLNIISLGGLALGIGMLVDNSIVVIESIFQQREAGLSPAESAIKGTGSVALAISASTLTTIAVFVPVVFTEGISGIVFKDLSMSVVYSLVFSLLVALTFIPSLSAALGNLRLRLSNRGGALWRPQLLLKLMDLFTNGFDRLVLIYRDFLARCLRMPKRVMMAALGIAAASLLSAFFLGFEFMPPIDQGNFLATVTLPEGLLIENALPYLEDIEARLLQIPEVVSITASMGASSTLSLTEGSSDASLTCNLLPLSERRRSSAELAEEARRIMADYPDGDVQISANDSIMDVMVGSGLSGFELTVKGPELEVLQLLEQQIVAELKEVASLRNIQSSLSQSRSEARISLDLKKALERGVNPQTAISLLRAAIEGTVPATASVDEGEEKIDVRVRIAPRYLDSIESLEYLMIPSALGTELPLAAFATIEEAPGISSLNRIDREPGFTISASVFGADISNATSAAEKQLQGIVLPQGYSMKVGGDSELMGDAFAGLANSLLLAVVLVYMVMVAQFESLKLPFLIMFAIPFGMTGAIFALVLARYSLSISSFIGLIALAGVVVNNAIVLIDSIETARREQPERPLLDVTAEACQTRLRPVFMTTLTTVIALIPLALGFGEGSEIMSPMAAAMVGGLLLSTLVTLVLVPSIYAALEQGKRKETEPPALEEAPHLPTQEV